MDFALCMLNHSGIKDSTSSMEQAKVLVQILAEFRHQNVMLQSTMDTLREQRQHQGGGREAPTDHPKSSAGPIWAAQ